MPSSGELTVLKSTPAFAECLPAKKLTVSDIWSRVFLRGWGVKRCRPTVAKPVISRVGPPWSLVRQSPPHLGSRELIFWSSLATCTRASFTHRPESTFVCERESDQSLRS